VKRALDERDAGPGPRDVEERRLEHEADPCPIGPAIEMPASAVSRPLRRSAVLRPPRPDLPHAYGLGIAISSAAFNQLLRGQTECGFMRASLSTIDIDGQAARRRFRSRRPCSRCSHPSSENLPPNTPLRVDIAPTIAPIVTGNPGRTAS